MGTNRRALIVGIENYQHLSKLDYAMNDAFGMYEALEDYSCQFDCNVLLDDEATSSRVKIDFRKLFEDAEEDAVLLFFFAGHGVTLDIGTFLVTLDKEADLDEGIDLQQLTQIIKTKRQPNQTFIFLLDCCHSGGTDIENVSVSIDNIQEIIMQASSGITLMAATEADKKAKESSRYEHGIFTYWLLQGLKGEGVNTNRDITTNSLFDYVARCMNEFHPSQKPVHKTTTIGKAPTFGTGFPKKIQPDISRLSESDRQDIDARIQEQLQRIRENLKFVGSMSWNSHIYKETSQKLSELIEWEKELESSHPELKTDSLLTKYESEFFGNQVQLANIKVEMNLLYGRVQEVIGEGGFGKVFAVEINTQREAYKVYHANQLQDKDKIKAFNRGFRAMERLDHPNIVKVTRQTQAPLGFYMQFINGRNLRDWWTDDNKKLMNVLHMVAQTLEHAHERGVIHRDIKPENIILDETDDDNPMPYLTDFDLAWYSMATTYSSLGNKAAFGHYLYAAPEQYESPGSEITKKPTADIYGFGQLCYFAICGKDPVADGGMSTSSLKARLENWTSAEAAEKFLAMYKQCIKRTPSDRYQSMSDVSTIILECRNKLIDPDKSKILSEDEFLHELLFALHGFRSIDSKDFYSKSLRTQIVINNISTRNIDLSFDAVQGHSAMTGTFEKQRNTINRRVDDLIEDYRKRGTECKRIKVTNGDAYRTKINILGNNISYDGVTLIREIILEFIKRIEPS